MDPQGSAPGPTFGISHFHPSFWMWEESGKPWNVPNFREKPQQVSSSPGQEWEGQMLKQYFCFQDAECKELKPAVLKATSQTAWGWTSFGPSAQGEKVTKPLQTLLFLLNVPFGNVRAWLSRWGQCICTACQRWGSREGSWTFLLLEHGDPHKKWHLRAPRDVLLNWESPWGKKPKTSKQKKNKPQNPKKTLWEKP